MIASGLLWYDDDAHRPLALKLAEAAQRYRERVGYEPTTCQLNPSQAPATAPAPDSTIATHATPKRVRARRGSRKAGPDLPPITLALIPDAGLRPNYFFIGVAEGEPLKRASIFRDDDNDEPQPSIPTVRHHRKNTNAQPGNISGNTSGNDSGKITTQQPAPHAPSPSPRNRLPIGSQAPATGRTSRRATRSGAVSTDGPHPANDRGNISGKNGNDSGNTSGNISGKNGKRTKAPAREQDLPARAAAPSVTAGSTESTSPRKTKTPAKTATIATIPATAVGPKPRTPKAATTPVSAVGPLPTTQSAPPTRTARGAHSAHAAKTATANVPARKTATSAAKTATPSPATETKSPARRVPAQAKVPTPPKTAAIAPAKLIQTKKAAITAKPAPPAATDMPGSVKAKSPAKTAVSLAASPAKIPARKSAIAPATSSRPTAIAPTTTAQPATTKSAKSAPIEPTLSPPTINAKTKKAAKTAKLAPLETPPSIPPASAKTKKAAKTATPPAKARPQPEASQADLWGEPVTVEPRRKTRRTA